MKRTFCLLVILFSGVASFANHLKGGWIQYEYLGAGSTANTSSYKITVRQYLNCNSTGGQIDQSIFLGVFDAVTNQLFRTLTIPISNDNNITKTTFDPCLQNPPNICYKIDIYVTTVDLPANPNGYTLAVQRCCRIAGIINVFNSNTVGITYSNTIPGAINGVDYSKNSSPEFAQKDTAVICFKSNFTFDFSATDKDGDSLSYSFCNGLMGGSNSQSQPNPPSNPPYSGIPYASGYNGEQPLGVNVSINSSTGIISGYAPSAIGEYTISVCALEYRKGILIGSTKKEIHITIADCSISGAKLDPLYINCKNLTFSFFNESSSSNIIAYYWKFGDVNNSAGDTSSNPTPTYTYKDTGTYTMKLKVTATGGCQDSATSQVKAYPRFKAGFSVTGSCLINPYQFKDLTIATYGAVTSWQWKFGDAPLTTDTSTKQNPSYQYVSTGSKQVMLIANSNKGCTDTLVEVINVSDKPSLSLPFHDTLICSIDTLPLIASSNGGTFTWTPNSVTTIYNANSATPLVFPKDTTTYIVTVNNNGCTNTDSVKVNVLPFISVDAGMDTAVCKTDTFRLHPVSDALSYQWTASSGIAVNPVKYPVVQPLISTKYYVTANLGKCQANDSVTVTVAPYPVATVSPDTSICFGNAVRLNGFVAGSNFYWTPANSLLNANTTTPVAGPSKTTAYILTAYDTTGCPKQVSDTVVVKVVQPIIVNAGKDTSVVINQPLQLQASIINTTGISFAWYPFNYLNNPSIANPVAIISSSVDSVLFKVVATDIASGCYGTGNVVVRVYKTSPDIFIPNAFTPNGDGRNDIFKPVLIGISKLDYFTVYNRWGQLLYSTTQAGQGWNGEANGTPQPSDTYVYIAQGTDYKGNTVFRKGTVVLIR